MKFCIKIWLCQKFSSASRMSSIVGKYCDFVTLFFVTFQQVSIGLSSGEYGGICSTLMRGAYSASRSRLTPPSIAEFSRTFGFPMIEEAGACFNDFWDEADGFLEIFADGVSFVILLFWILDLQFSFSIFENIL